MQKGSISRGSAQIHPVVVTAAASFTSAWSVCADTRSQVPSAV